jgi:hypothetical protein
VNKWTRQDATFTVAEPGISVGTGVPTETVGTRKAGCHVDRQAGFESVVQVRAPNLEKRPESGKYLEKSGRNGCGFRELQFTDRDLKGIIKIVRNRAGGWRIEGGRSSHGGEPGGEVRRPAPNE